jgi:two-component system, OmpR family, sensor histidine kinase KdpD
MKAPPLRRTPEELLREVTAEEARRSRGRLKLFLGYASGVGKSFRMFDEARRRSERSQDVVVGAVQPAVPPEVAALLPKLEVIPLRNVNGTPAMDVDALRRRHPGVCVIDGLAYDNPPGSRNPTRWADVSELLQAGINVIASINIQYVAELRAKVEPLTGKHVDQTVPIAFIKSADEIVIVDAPAVEAVEHGSEADAPAAEREQKLVRLRELALLVAADVVEHQLTGYLEEHGIQQHFGTMERILVCVTPRASIDEMLETAQWIAEKFHGELIAAYVNQPQISPEDKAALDQKLAKAREAGAIVEILAGVDAADTLLAFARSRGVTQLFIGHTQRAGLWPRLWGSPVDKLIRCSEGIDIRVFPQAV